MFVLIWVTLLFSVRGSNASKGNITAFNTENQTSAELHGTNVTCKVSFNNITTDEAVTLNVTLFPRILSSSACEVQSEVLTCVCMSEGFPLPTIKWPLLKNHAEYSVITTVSNHTVNSTVTLTVKDHSNTVVCVSSIEVGEAKENLTIITSERREDILKKLLITVKQPQVIIAFLIGVLFSAIICCLARKCHRKKQKSSENVAETLEMVTTQAVSLIDAVQAVENDGTHDQEAAEGGAEAAGPSAHVEPKEVEYSDIDFFMLKRKRATETQETTETEYAEIKKQYEEERQDDGGEDGEMLEGNEEEEVIKGKDTETRQCMSAEEEGGEGVAVYSSVNQIMGEI